MCLWLYVPCGCICVSVLAVCLPVAVFVHVVVGMPVAVPVFIAGNGGEKQERGERKGKRELYLLSPLVD